VLTTLNIQHLESLNDVVFQITGIKVNETIPDYIVQRASEVVVVDLTPDALQNRMRRGNIYDLNKVPQALKNFFRKGNLNALRELTLREIAEEVDEDLAEYMKKEGIRDNWRTVERIMICISPSITAKKLIRRGARLANRYKCEWHVVTVDCTNHFAKKTSLKEQEMLHSHFQLANQLGAETTTLEGKSVSEELAKWANEKHITQLFIGYPKRTKIEKLLRGSTVNRLIRKLNNVDIHLIANDI
jgi:two-component system sensor histidine kinase KdpD